MKLLVVVVNYRTSDLAIDCLRSLEAELTGLPGACAVVVDNDSGDGSAERIEAAIASEGWSSWVSLVRSPHNGGFAYGNNLALRPALQSGDPPEFVHLLNPDAMVRPGAIRTLIRFLEANPEVGIAGSFLEAPDGREYPAAFRFFSLWSEFDQGLRLGLVSKLLRRWGISPALTGGNQQVDWVCGASMMIRREVFEMVGYFDERYFLYYEEADFCLQAHRAGWQCYFVPESRAVHVLSAATQVLTGQRRRPRYWFDSRKHYLIKNHGRFYALFGSVMWALGFSFWRLRRIIQRKPDTDPPHLLRDFIRFTFFDSKGWIASGRAS